MAETYNFEIDQGSTFTLPLTWNDAEGDPINLTGFAARMEVRSPNLVDVFDEFTDGSGITLGGATGTIDVLFESSDTSDYTWRNGVYDIKMTDPASVVTRIMQGAITVDPDVTKDAV